MASIDKMVREKKKYKCRGSKDSHSHRHLSQISEDREAMETLKGDAQWKIASLGDRE